MNLLINTVLSIDPCIPADRTRHSPLRNRFRCRDGKWVLGTHHPEKKYWATFCKATGQSHLLNDPRFTTQDGAPTNYVELNAIFDKVFASKLRDEWMEIFLSHGLLACSVQKIQEVPNDPQALANNFVVPFDHPLQGHIKIPGYPIHFSACTAGTTSAAPQLGEHTELVLRELGYTDREIDELKKAEIIQ
jgi:crotonobetainyl-CoA:carnitine CoA-transferase CaiB-like acyl-CoA transferase